METETVEQLHDRAMDAYQNARQAEVLGNINEAYELRLSALEMEEKAAAHFLLLLTPKSEPTRGILYRSAAWMAFNLEYYEKSVQLADEGLNGCPSPEIEAELKGVRDNAIREWGRFHYANKFKTGHKNILYWDELWDTEKDDVIAWSHKRDWGRVTHKNGHEFIYKVETPEHDNDRLVIGAFSKIKGPFPPIQSRKYSFKLTIEIEAPFTSYGRDIKEALERGGQADIDILVNSFEFKGDDIETKLLNVKVVPGEVEDE